MLQRSAPCAIKLTEFEIFNYSRSGDVYNGYYYDKFLEDLPASMTGFMPPAERSRCCWIINTPRSAVMSPARRASNPTVSEKALPSRYSATVSCCIQRPEPLSSVQSLSWCFRLWASEITWTTEVWTFGAKENSPRYSTEIQSGQDRAELDFKRWISIKKKNRLLQGDRAFEYDSNKAERYVRTLFDTCDIGMNKTTSHRILKCILRKSDSWWHRNTDDFSLFLPIRSCIAFAGFFMFAMRWLLITHTQSNELRITFPNRYWSAIRCSSITTIILSRRGYSYYWPKDYLDEPKEIFRIKLCDRPRRWVTGMMASKARYNKDGTDLQPVKQVDSYKSKNYWPSHRRFCPKNRRALSRARRSFDHIVKYIKD